MIETNDANFENDIKEGKVIIDFSAPWCGPCKIFSPILEKISKNYNIKIMKLDIDANPIISQKFDIQNIPCLILFENGIEKLRSVGLKTESNVIELFGLRS